MKPLLDRYPEQDDDATWVSGRDRGLLLLDPRVGKTPVALVGAERRGARKIVVLTRAIGREVWRRHQKVWAPGLSMMVESYDRLARSQSAFDAIRAFKPDVLILDECQQLKNPASKRTKIVYGRYCDRVGGLSDSVGGLWGLSGTIAPNNLAETWTHLHAMGRTQMRWRAFTEHFCETWDTQYGLMIKGVREEHLEEFKALLRPVSRRRRFRDVFPHLPRASWTTIPLALEGEDRKRLAALEGDLAAKTVRSALQRARTDEEREQILASAMPHSASLRKALGEIKAPLVAEEIIDLLESGIHKLVVFAWHPSMLTAMRKLLGKYHPVQVDGSTPEAQRIAAIDTFQEDPRCRLIFGQIDTMGEAVALHAARHVLLAEYSWSLGKLLQAVNRIITPDRLDRPEILACSLAGTIDDDVGEAAQRKAEHLDVFNNL